VLAAVTFLAVVALGLPLFVVLLVLGPVGVWMNRPGTAGQHHLALASHERDT